MISDLDSRGALAFDVPKKKAPCVIKEMDGRSQDQRGFDHKVNHVV